MASRPKKISVSVTPGQNVPVKHVIRFEDLLQKVQQAAPKAAVRRGAAAATATTLGPIQQLAADLEARMRELRGGDAPPSPVSPARAARGRRKA